MNAVIIITALVLYFLPTIAAAARGHRNETAILVLNLFLGWTFVGWVIALVWAFTNDRSGETVAAASAGIERSPISLARALLTKAVIAGVGVAVIIMAAIYKGDEPAGAIPPPAAPTPAIAPAGTIPAMTRTTAQPGKSTVLEDVRIDKFVWRREGTTFVGAFALVNDGTADIKNVRIACKVFAASGTELETKTATVYDVFKAKSPRTVARLEMGSIHPQTARSFCKVVDFTTI